MINVLLDPLPESWESADGTVYELDMDFRIGIQICLIQEDPDMTDLEKSAVACQLLFKSAMPKEKKDIEACMKFFMGGWSHDKSSPHKEKNRLMDFDVDQWRIYAAFLQQYRIDLSDEGLQMHWWKFMGLLSALNECSYTRVVEIRRKEIKPKMDKDAKKALREAKTVYALEKQLTYEEREFASDMDDLLGVSSSERKRIEDFEKYGRGD